MHLESGACEHGLEGIGRAERSEHGRTSPWHPRGSTPQERARKQSATGETLYMDEVFERRTDQDGENPKSIFHVGAIGRAIAQVTFEASDQSEDVTYLHTDQQGSIRLITSSGGGAALAVRHYGPFGEPVDVAGESSAIASEDVRFGYTGHEHDTELGLINMRGRIFDPVLRGFLTPDPIVPDVFDTESYNPYAYVRNNPLRFIDPSGFVCVQIGSEGVTLCDPVPTKENSGGGGSSSQGSSQEGAGGASSGTQHPPPPAIVGPTQGGVVKGPTGTYVSSEVSTGEGSGTGEGTGGPVFTGTELIQAGVYFDPGSSTPFSDSSPGPALQNPGQAGQFAVINWSETFASTKRAADFISRVANGASAEDAWVESKLTRWDVAVAFSVQWWAPSGQPLPQEGLANKFSIA